MEDRLQLEDAEDRLSEAGVASAAYEAETLAAHVRRQYPADEQAAALDSLVARRCRREPLERLIGSVRFRQLELLVGPGVFVPQPETSPVVGWAVERLHQMISTGVTSPVCVDLCTGAGTVALSLAAEAPQARVHAVELDPHALVWTQRNVAHNGLEVTLHQGDAAHALPELNGQVDLLASNPPYVATSELASVAAEVREHDPAVSLLAGSDGLDLVRAVESAGRRLLRPGGQLVVEHSDRQGVTAPAVFDDSEVWRDVRDHVDHEGKARFVTAQRC